MENEARRKHSITVRNNLILTTIIVAFFLCVIVFYYMTLYSATRENIIKNGELNAVRSANRIENYLSLGTNIVALTGYTIDDMMEHGKSNKKIQEYLISQNSAASDAANDEIAGIYGYIRGEFINGLGWTPYAGYDPTNRPWYKRAIEGKGEVVAVNPYLDARTGSTMITMAKMLSDGKSVIAIDVSTDELQQITEDIANTGSTGIEIVLDTKYRVISHSNRYEVGLYYNENNSSFGAELLRKLKALPPGENYFFMNYRGGRYVVYEMKIENDWTCISATNTTTVFDGLRIPLVITVIAAILIIAGLLFIMIRSYRKEALAEKMRQLADEQSEIARADPMTGLKNRRAYAETLSKLSQSLPQGCKVVVFDLNGLKEANDTYGHEAGDNLIIAAADCIRTSFEGVEDIFRIGGDEFCLITTMDQDKVDACLKKLEVMSKEYKGEYVDGVSISSGIGTDKEHAHIENIVREADKNMYIQKQNYYNMAEHDRRRKPR